MVEKQARFVKTVSIFIQKATKEPYSFTFGEAFRPENVAEMYDSVGKGIKNSLHCKRLAIDLNAFYYDDYLDGHMEWHIPHLKKLGELWKSLDPEAAWGGDFKRKDYNHYSFEHNGVR
jgi:hypothetical protein